MGRHEEADELLTRIREESKKIYFSSTMIAAVYGALGEIEQAFLLLEKAYSERDVFLCHLMVNSFFDSLRSDPRYKILLKKMNFEK